MHSDGLKYFIPDGKRLAGGPDVPEPRAAVVPGSRQVVLLIGVEVDAPENCLLTSAKLPPIGMIFFST